MREPSSRSPAAEALPPGEASRRAMFETALDCVVTMDSDGRLVEFTPAAERTFGYRAGEAAPAAGRPRLFKSTSMAWEDLVLAQAVLAHT